jgi:DNA-binding response OmpR family regulator
MSTKVLIVEDDVDLGPLLSQYLKINDFHTSLVCNGVEAMAALGQQQYDILIIDVIMPEEDGFQFAKKLVKVYPGLPFLFVTARKMKEDVMKGLSLGADDYIIKPFDADELILRLKNILKRSKNALQNTDDIISIGNYYFDPANLRLKSSSTEHLLTEKEAQLLHYFCKHQDELIKRNDILDNLWEESDFFKGRSMDVFISRLRKYLVDDPSIHIESVRGVGFRFSVKHDVNL